MPDRLLAIESAVNQAMREISFAILKDATHLPPVLRLEKLGKYTFNTPNDGRYGSTIQGVDNIRLGKYGSCSGSICYS